MHPPDSSSSSSSTSTSERGIGFRLYFKRVCYQYLLLLFYKGRAINHPSEEVRWPPYLVLAPVCQPFVFPSQNNAFKLEIY